MKIKLTILAAIVMLNLGKSQTLNVPDNIGISTIAGKIGIGTTTPSGNLHLKSNISFTSFDIERFTPNSQWRFSVGNFGSNDLYIHPQNENVNIVFGDKTRTTLFKLVTETGNVGIGTTSPLQKFNVHGNSGSPSTSGTIQNGIAAFSSSDTYSTLFIGNYSTSPWGMWMQASSRHDLSGNHPIILNPNGGKVGIGVVSPEEILHVNGTMTITGDIGAVIDGNHWQTGKHTLELQNNDAGDVVLAFHRAGYTIASIRHSSLGGLIFSGSGAYNSNHMYVKSNGNVGIGTDNPKTKLSVNGTIISSEIKVLADINQYPDFVFSDEYNLRSLKEVEKYIEDNKHLPEIPKADEVKDGIALGEMNNKLLQKIEELTLYMIEQNNEIEMLKETLIKNGIE